MIFVRENAKSSLENTFVRLDFAFSSLGNAFERLENAFSRLENAFSRLGNAFSLGENVFSLGEFTFPIGENAFPLPSNVVFYYAETADASFESSTRVQRFSFKERYAASITSTEASASSGLMSSSSLPRIALWKFSSFERKA